MAHFLSKKNKFPSNVGHFTDDGMYNPRILKYATTVTFSPRWELVDDGVYKSRILKQSVIATFLPRQEVVSFTTSYLAACRLL